MTGEQYETRLRRDFGLLEAIVITIAGLFSLMGAANISSGDAVYSRLATVYSLTKHGTWAIDRPLDQPANPFEQRTIDKVMIGEHLYSSKPPVLPLAMTAEYIVLNKVLGWDLDDEQQTVKIVRFMSFTLIGVSYIVALLFFAKTLRFVIDDACTRLVLVWCLAFATQLWGYSYHINNHVPAAAMLMIALYLAIGMRLERLAPAAWRFVLFGLVSGLVATLDLPATIFAGFAGLALMAKHPVKTLAWGLLGAAIPLGIHSVAMMQATGSALPVQTRNDLYLSEGSYWRQPLMIDANNEPKPLYLFHMTLGRCGVFSLFPILLAGMAGALRALVRRNTPHRTAILLGALAFAILTAYYAYKTNNYGGQAFGFRWYIAAMPVLLLMGAPLMAGLRVRWQWMFVAVAAGISFYSAFECAKSPWGANNQWTTRLFLGPSYGPIDPAP